MRVVFSKLIGVFIFLILYSFSIYSQTGTIRGFVYDKETGEPIIFTNVILAGTTIGASTDVNGYYAISKVPPGDYKLSITYLGYDTLKEAISLKANEILTRKLYLSKGAVNLNTFEVSAEKQEDKTEVKMSVVKITPKDIKQLPTVGGEADIAQYMQVLPGVVFTGDQGGQLYIRGGSPIQNKVMLDGMVIYNPFHTIGLFSVFDTDIIRNADVHTGGFGAQYGGRISSVIDIRTRDGNKKRISGKVGASTFGAKAMLEGPIFKEKKPGGSSASYILSGKTSYLDKSSKILYTYIDSAGLPFNFTDLYGKISFNGSNGSKFNLFGFNYSDKVRWKSISDLNWNTWGVGSNFLIVPGTSPVLVEGNFSYSQYKILLAEGDLPPRSSSINGFNLGLDFTYFLGDNEVKYGVQVLGFSTEFKFFNGLNRQIEQNANTTEFSAYLKYKWNLGKLIVEPSFRAQYYASFPTFSPEPRLGAKYNVNDKFRLKLASGIYSQNLISANSDRDVVNIFSGFISGPDNLQDSISYANGKTVERKHALQKAIHLIFGFEVDVTKKINLNIEGYYKKFTQLTNLNRNKIFDDNASNYDKPDLLKKDFIIETGNAYGVDFVLKYDYKRFYLWAVYSLAMVNRWNGIELYHPVFDRRHNANFLLTYNFGKKLNWDASVRWNLGSGFPFTQTAGYYEKYTFTDGVNSNYTQSNGQLGTQYSTINGGRLPYYHRLDLNIKRTIILSQNSTMEVNLGVTNAYNRENIFYFDRVKYERVNQLPFMPSFGLNWTF